MTTEATQVGNNQPDAASAAAAASAVAATSPEAKAAATAQAGEKAAADKTAADKAAADAAAVSPEAKAAADAADKAAAKAAAAPAPEKYEPFKAPEGVTLDAPVITAFEATAKELGLSQDKAQALIDKVAPAMHKQTVEAVAQVRADMLAAAQADKEIGGDNFVDSVATAKLAMDAYFAPSFVKFLNESGLGNHPEMIRGLRKAGIPLRPDGWVSGGKAAATGDAREMYPNSKMAA